MAGLAAVLSVSLGSGCSTGCPDPECVGSLELRVASVIGSLVPRNAYEAVVCIDGDCVEATFALPPPAAPCDFPVADGSLCCKTTWPRVGNLDCRAVGTDLELTLPLPKGDPSRKAHVVVVTVIDSEGDETLRDETATLAPDGSTCASDCRHERLTL